MIVDTVETVEHVHVPEIQVSPSPVGHSSEPAPFRLGIGGPVGTGKTALVVTLCRALWPQVDLAVVTNDIYTTEDARFVQEAGVLPVDRVVGVETGGCPHTAIRDDVSLNLEAIAQLHAAHPGLRLVLVESGGDNLAASFSPDLVDASIYVIDVAGGDKVPRKGGPGITRSDMLIINKIDLAAAVGASLSVMERDSAAARAGRPFLFTDLRGGVGIDALVTWVLRQINDA